MVNSGRALVALFGLDGSGWAHFVPDQIKDWLPDMVASGTRIVNASFLEPKRKIRD